MRSAAAQSLAALAVLANLASSVHAQISPQQVYEPPSASSGAVSQQSNLTNGVNPQYANLLGNALWFYDAQRSGALPADNRVSWRNSSCENDGSLNGTDLSGGWYDAGDYVKATYPLCWTMTSIAWSALSFGSAYGRSSQDAYLDSTLRWGLDWLSKTHSDNNTLWIFVGNPTIDNQYWGGDQNIPDPRTSYSVTRQNPGQTPLPRALLPLLRRLTSTARAPHPFQLTSTVTTSEAYPASAIAPTLKLCCATQRVCGTSPSTARPNRSTQ